LILEEAPFPTEVFLRAWPRGLSTSYEDFQARLTTLRTLLTQTLDRWEMTRELEKLCEPFTQPSTHTIALSLNATQREMALNISCAFMHALAKSPLLVLCSMGVLQGIPSRGEITLALGHEVFHHLFCRSTLGEPLFFEGSIGFQTPPPLEDFAQIFAGDAEALSIQDAHRLWMHLRGGC